MADYIMNMGGNNDSSQSVTTVDVFNATEMGIKKTTAGLTLSVARQELAAATCGDYVLAMGGNATSTYYNTVDVFHVTDNGIEAVAGHDLALSVARSRLATATCGDYVLAMGGDDTSNYYNTVDVFRVTDNGIEAVAGHGLSLSVARRSLAAAACGDYILAMGGGKTSSTYSDAVDVFRVTDNGIEAVADHGLALSVARRSLAAATCGNYVLAMGGYNGDFVNTIDVFRVTDNGIEAVAGHGLALSTARSWFAGATCGNYILAMGGWHGSETYYDAIDVFHVTENGIEYITGHGLNLSTGRGGLAAATVGNYILAMGGHNSSGQSSAVDVFELF